MALLFTPNNRLDVDQTPVTSYPITLACWFRSVQATAPQRMVFIGDKDVGNQFLCDLHLNGGFVRAQVFDGTAAEAAAINTYSSNTWHHACGVFASTTSRSAYRDGGNKGTNSTLVSPTGADRITLGISGDSTPTWYMDGRLAEVAVWNAALTDDEVALLGVGYAPPFVRPGNLVFYMPLVRNENEDIVGGLSLTSGSLPSVADHVRIIYPAPKHLSFAAAAAPPEGLSIPIAMHHYKQLMGAN